MSYKIGDRVRELFYGREHVIVATKEVPHKGIMGDIYPNDGMDYILVEANQDVGKFTPLLHVHGEHIEKLK